METSATLLDSSSIISYGSPDKNRKGYLMFAAFLGSALTSLFTYIGFGVVVLAILYGFYRYYQYRNPPPEAEFSDIEAQRQQRVQEVRTYTISTSVELQQQTEHILTGIQQEREHLENLIVELSQNTQDIQSNQAVLQTTTQELQGTVINPFQAFLDKVKLSFQTMSEQINQLIAIYTVSNKALIDREKELATILENLYSADRSLRSIGDIRDSIATKDRKINHLQEQVKELAKKINEMVAERDDYEKIIQAQKQLIEVLELSQNTFTVGVPK